MAVEIDKLGSKRYTSPRSDVIRVVPNQGHEYTISPLDAGLDDAPFPAWIYEPEDPVTDELTVYEYGLGESGAICENEAHHIAMLGMPVAVHDTPRSREMPSFYRWATNPHVRKDLVRHALNPLILPSQATESVVDAAQDHDGSYTGVIAKSRSMGGISGIMHAAHDPRVQTLYLDGSAGLVLRNAMANHVGSLVGIAKDEIVPAATYMMRHGPEGAVDRIMKHFTDDPVRLLREVGFLILRRPDISNGLEELRERGTSVIVLHHELDQFFKDGDVQTAAEQLVKRGLISFVERSRGTRHVHGIEKPRESAQLFHDLVLRAKHAAQPVATTVSGL